MLHGKEKPLILKFSFGINLTPELNFLLVDSRDNQSSKTRLGASSGLNLKYKVSKNIFFQTGFGYGIKRYDYIQEGLIFPSDIDPVKGIISSSEIVTKFLFNEIQIPLLIQIDVANHKYFLSSGIALNRIFKNKSTHSIHYGNGEIEELSPTNNKAMYNSAFILSLGYNLKVSNKIKLSIEPMLKLYFKEYDIDHSQLCNFGIKTTCYFGKG